MKDAYILQHIFKAINCYSLTIGYFYFAQDISFGDRIVVSKQITIQKYLIFSWNRNKKLGIDIVNINSCVRLWRIISIIIRDKIRRLEITHLLNLK